MSPKQKLTKEMVQFFASMVDTFLLEVLKSYSSEEASEEATVDRIVHSAKMAQVGVIICNYFKSSGETMLSFLPSEQKEAARLAALEATIPIAKLFHKKAAEWNETAAQILNDGATGKLVN